MSSGQYTETAILNCLVVSNLLLFNHRNHHQPATVSPMNFSWIFSVLSEIHRHGHALQHYINNIYIYIYIHVKIMYTICVYSLRISHMYMLHNMHAYVKIITRVYVFMYIHVYVYMCIYVCIYIYMCVYVYIYIYVYRYKCIYVYMYICTFVCIHTHIYI